MKRYQCCSKLNIVILSSSMAFYLSVFSSHSSPSLASNNSFSIPPLNNSHFPLENINGKSFSTSAYVNVNANVNACHWLLKASSGEQNTQVRLSESGTKKKKNKNPQYLVVKKLDFVF